MNRSGIAILTFRRRSRTGTIVRALFLGARVLFRMLGKSAGLFVASAHTSPPDDEISSSIRGGILNYRTGKLDDGTDPGGLYDRD